MKAVAIPGPPPLDGLLRYVDSEYAFAFDSASPADLHKRSGLDGVTSLSIGTLQIEVGVQTRLLLFAWGLHPRTSWLTRPVGRPKPVCGVVKLEPPAPLQPGVSVQLAPVGVWTTAYDEMTGWLRVAERLDRLSEEEVLIANGVVVGITAARLDSLWLAPYLE